MISVRSWFWPKSLAKKALAGLVVTALLLAITWFVALFVTERRLDAAMKSAEVEFGFSNNLDDCVPMSLPPERNSASPLDEAGAIADQILLSAPKLMTFRVARKFHSENPSFAS